MLWYEIYNKEVYSHMLIQWVKTCLGVHTKKSLDEEPLTNNQSFSCLPYEEAKLKMLKQSPAISIKLPSQHIDSQQIEPQLHIQELTCWRNPKTQATLKNISLTVYPGEILVLMGSSGSGKTSILRVIAGLEKYCQGQVYIQGQCVQGGTGFDVATEHRQVGFVFQDYALFPHLTVYQNIEFGLKHLDKKAKKDRVQELMLLLNIEELSHRYPHQLSGGQQQRVALARAVAPKPRLLLLDEPFSHLDHELRDQVRQDLIQTLREAQMTMVWVTHDQKEAFHIADRVALLQNGELLTCQTPQALYFNPPSYQVAQWLGEWTWWHVLVDTQFIYTPIGRYERHGFILPHECTDREKDTENLQDTEGKQESKIKENNIKNSHATHDDMHIYLMGLKTQGWFLSHGDDHAHISSPFIVHQAQLHTQYFAGSHLQCILHCPLDHEFQAYWKNVQTNTLGVQTYNHTSYVPITLCYAVHNLDQTLSLAHGHPYTLYHQGQVLFFPTP